MEYQFVAYGNPNIFATHKTTLEFTKDSELTLKGDCIVGVNADFDLNKLKEFIKKAKNSNITITIEPINNKKIKEIIQAELNPSFNSDNELVIRKTSFASERTFAIKSDKAAFELGSELINCLKEKSDKFRVLIENRQY